MTGARFLCRLAVFVVAVALLCAPAARVGSGQSTGRNAAGNPDKSRLPADALGQFIATATPDGVLIEWRTNFELDNLGFNIYRERNGRREQVNPGLIAGSVLLFGQGTALPAGYSYAWFDSDGTPDSKYSLEQIDLGGQSRIHEAVAPVWSHDASRRRSSELGNLKADGAQNAQNAQNEWAGHEPYSLSSKSSEGISTASISDQWAIANQPGLKIGVRTDGWYRVTQPEMAAAGFDTSADARNLRMFRNATELAIRVSRDSGALTPADYIEFWGQGLDTTSTDTQIYWLLNGAQTGKRIRRTGELHTETAPAQQPSPARVNDFSIFDGVTGGMSGGFVTFDVSDRSTTKERENKPAADEPAVVSNEPVPVSNMGHTRAVNETANAPAVNERSGAGKTDGAPANSSSASNAAPPVGSEQIAVSSKKRRAGARRSATRFLRSLKKSRSKRSRQTQSRRPRRHHAIAMAATPAFIYTVERKDRTIYYPSALNGQAENFFGLIVSGDPPPLTLTLRNIETTAPGPAQVQIKLQGVAPAPHVVNVSVNNTLIGTINFFGTNPAVTRTLPVPVSVLIEGNNLVKLLPTAGSSDVTIVEHIRISYPRSFTAENNSLRFNARSTQSVKVDGFTSPDIRVLDVSDADAVQEVRPILETSGGGFAATVPAGERGKGRRLVALPGTQISQAASLALNQPSTLNLNSNAADLLIISYKDFIPALAPLIAQRQAQGYVVKTVDVEDLYDEFSYGAHASQAIRDFLSLALNSWTNKPEYLLLVGDGSYDPRNYLGQGRWDFVPSQQVDTFFTEADSDESLVDFNNDGIGEISVGRLPVRTVAETNLIVSKIVGFIPANTPQSALMVADNPIGYNFEFFTEQLIPLLPAGMGVQRVYRAQLGDAATKAAIINQFNSGQALVNYSGHGNVDIWGGSVFTSNDAMALTNGNKLPFVFVMDCLNGFFADPVKQGLAESLLKAPNGGAVASFASSGLTTADPQHQMGQKMFELLYQGPSIPIGDASRQSKTATFDLDVRRTWILFGDPTMKIR